MVDVVVLGATGYTGKLITRYLAVHRERGSFKLGLAARSKSKLDQLVSELSILDVQTFTVDVADDTSIEALFRDSQTKVVLSTVGPYLKWGMPVARACARNGVHYVDLTGETIFVKNLIKELDMLAMKTKTILIPSCGFDSIPSDAMAYLSARTLGSTLKSLGQHDLDNVGLAVSHTRVTARVGVSGGSIASGLNLIESVPRKQLLRSQAADVLSPIKLRVPRTQKLVSVLPIVRPKRYGYIAPLVPHNVAIVQRTHGLYHTQAKKFESGDGDSEDVQPAYADDFAYSESWAAPNQTIAFLISLGITIGGACLVLFPPFRWIVKRLIRAPGQGPSDEELEKGYLKCQNISVSTPLPGSNKTIVVESQLHARGDPGYTLTAIMASEVALALLSPPEKLLPLARQGGVLTPMSALGTSLLKRLSASGRFDFESNVWEDQ